jgi:hypothetical protein
MPSINSIHVDTLGLRLESETGSERRWLNDVGEPTSLHFFDLRPNIPIALDDREGLRTWYRGVALGAGLGLIDFAIVDIDEIPSIRVVLKGVLDNATGHGRTYVGSLTIPFDNFSFVIKAQYREWGVTGSREAVMIDRLWARGVNAPMQGWIVDSSDPTPAHLAMNVSEEPRYDSEFPKHPLSRVRSSLDRLQTSIRIAPDLKHLRVFRP